MENDKIMTQTLDSRYIRETNTAQWKMREDSVIVWQNKKEVFSYDRILQDWFKTKTEITEMSPEESNFKCKKSMDIDVLLLREVMNNDEFTKQILCYHRIVHVKVRDDYPNIWLTAGDNGKVFVKDLLKQATWCCTLTTDDYVTVKKLSEHKISKEDAVKLTTGYIYAKEESDRNGTYLYGQFVAPKGA